MPHCFREISSVPDMRLLPYIIFTLAAIVLCHTSDACTAVIISGKATADGRPIMWKNRDSGFPDNNIRHFKGEIHSFVGLVNSGSEGGEVWAGVNTAGFAVMNTASYCLKDDDVPASQMDREGRVMYRALEICSTLADFEHFLDTLRRPMGVEANFGCIDAHGGAAWYETDNDSWHKIDVNGSRDGFVVVTNFSVSGRPSGWKGVERYMTAQAVFNEIKDEGALSGILPADIMDRLSRSYRHEVLGIDLIRDSSAFFSSTSGLFVDQDFIPRNSTSASVIISGAASGDNPLSCVLWAALGYPSCSVLVPVPVSADDHVPDALKLSPEESDSTFCGLSAILKKNFIFRSDVSSMSHYMDLRPVLAGVGGYPSMLSCCRKADCKIYSVFHPLFAGYVSGAAGEEEYLSGYDSISDSFYGIYLEYFEGYIHL